ncbi:reverse transcriptase domain-containing protein [Archangium violaceum]|uniref:reverse transcriptase domain-containing protein n=1 Tax=Archangium violaceum TaxID=83451 RepID=UPI002B2ED10C|nr:reverse transcriptase domain-containing protein [Archangium gephyra]
MPPPNVGPKEFSGIKSPEDLAAFLMLPLGQLRFHARNASRYYKEFKIKKRAGGFRTIHAPSGPLKAVQRKISQGLLATYTPRNSVRGFTPSQNVVTNAEPHASKKLVLNLDLVDFFHSIHRGRVIGAMMAKPFSLPRNVATLVADICCFNGKLPQGAPSSPVISNIICWNLDRDLERLAGRHYCYYTRYADDITFSTSARAFPITFALQQEPSAQASSELERLILKNGFQVNRSKTRLLPRNKRQEVTGLVVNKFPNTDRRFIRQIRAMLHAWRKFGIEKAQADYEAKYWHPKVGGHPPPDFKRVLLGKISFVGQVRSKSSKIYRNLLEAYAKLNPQFALQLEPGPQKSIVQLADDCTWILESESELQQGTGFMLKGIGLVTCEHVLASGMKAFRSSPSEIGKKYEIEVLYKNKYMDIAVLQILGVDQNSLPAMSRGDSEALKALDDLFVIGFANYNFGDSPEVKQCKVSGFGKKFGERRIKINTGIISGMSGGPVTLPDGSVIGVAVTGADYAGNVDESSVVHGVVPVELLDKLILSSEMP